jgi:exopolysaccharide production protein ExoY
MQATNRICEAAESAPATTVGAESQSLEWRDWPRTPLGGFPKRVFDLTVASIVLLFIAPLLFVLMIAVKLQDGGPALYGHSRIGLGGRSFKCLKLRTMITNSDEALRRHLASDPAAAREWAANRKLANDPRITSLGRFLRRSSLDELPQILNVLRGEMSLVGPRPVVREELVRYDLAKVHYLKARPGITGLWQVSGRSNTSYGRRVELDKAYVLRWTLLKDILIMLRTVPALATRSGAV